MVDLSKIYKFLNEAAEDEDEETTDDTEEEADDTEPDEGDDSEGGDEGGDDAEPDEGGDDAGDEGGDDLDTGAEDGGTPSVADVADVAEESNAADGESPDGGVGDESGGGDDDFSTDDDNDSGGESSSGSDDNPDGLPDADDDGSDDEPEEGEEQNVQTNILDLSKLDRVLAKKSILNDFKDLRSTITAAMNVISNNEAIIDHEVRTKASDSLVDIRTQLDQFLTYKFGLMNYEEALQFYFIFVKEVNNTISPIKDEGVKK